MGVIINNQNTKILGFPLKSRPLIPSADKKYETIEVEGRNGALTRFVSYEDLKFKLTFNILFQNDIKQKLREIKGLMANAKTLSFDDAPNFYYKVKQAHLSDTETIIKSSGVFTVEFVAEPFEYEASSVLEYTNPTKILVRNNTTYYSQPIIKIYGSGNIKLSVNNEIIEIKNLMDCIVIDSELQEAYHNDINKNNLMSGDFPKFEIKENTVEIVSGKVDKMQILPQWRWLT